MNELCTQYGATNLSNITSVPLDGISLSYVRGGYCDAVVHDHCQVLVAAVQAAGDEG